MVCCTGLSTPHPSEIGNPRLGGRFVIESVLAERHYYSRYLAFDQKAGEIRLLELQRITPQQQTVWHAKAETARRLRHPGLVRCLEVSMVSDTLGLLLFDAPSDEYRPERLELQDVARVGLSLASLLVLLHRVGFGFLVPLIHRTYWRRGVSGPEVRVEALSRAVGGFQREPFCARCLPDVPPELVNGGHPSPAGDAFILGAFLYRLLTGNALPPGGLDQLVPAEKGPGEEVIRLVQTDPKRRPPSTASVCRNLMAYLKSVGAESAPPPSFGYVDPGPERQRACVLARSYIVPGLSTAAVERMVDEETDTSALEKRIADALWGNGAEGDKSSNLEGTGRWLERGRLAMKAGKAAEAVDAFRQALSEACSLEGQARVRGYLGLQLGRMGRLREGGEELSLALELLNEGENDLALSEVRLCEAEVDLATGQWTRARRTLEEHVSERRAYGDGRILQESLLNLAELELMKGAESSARSRIEEALRLADRRKDLHGRLRCLLLEINSQALCGQWGEVLNKAKALERQIARTPYARLRARTLLWMGRAAVECGNPEKAGEVLERAREGIRSISEPVLEARLDQVLALLLVRQGIGEEAVLVFEKAIERLEGTSHPYVLAEIYTDFALACSGLAPDSLIESRRQTARQTAWELGAKPLLSALEPGPPVDEKPSLVIPGFVATSPLMLAVLEQIDNAAPFDVPIHVRGESGTGKELVARAIHDRSPYSANSFVALNCAAIPDSLLEAELFGHARGAFTGADRARPGLLEGAHGGTLFLDEVADLSPRGQTLLLRVLEDKEYRKLGECRVRRSDFRLVSATHRRLDEEVAAGRFREDLYFRLKVVEIELPPLRERREDILPVARYFIEAKASQLRLPRASLELEVEKALLAYSWPGNIRELENELVQALLRLGAGGSLRLEHFSPTIRGKTKPPLRFASEDFERRYLRDALARHGGNRTRAARALGLTRQGLYKKLRRHGMETRVYRAG